MITKDYVITMATYNRWQNGSLYQAAATLSDAARREDRGAFFGSIHKTLNHLLWADQMWMSRFAQTPRPTGGIPESVDLQDDFAKLKAAREALDNVIIEWATALDPSWLDGEFTWFSGSTGHEITRAKALLVTHMFNHQTHHRGQVHAMLTAQGAKPTDTDLLLMPQ